MSKEQSIDFADSHKVRHQILHDELDELVADFITHTRGLPSKSTIMELMQWSKQQAVCPAENKDDS